MFREGKVEFLIERGVGENREVNVGGVGVEGGEGGVMRGRVW